jgi:hypothetical protein
MTDTKRHLIDMVVEHTVKGMDMGDLISFVSEVLYHDYVQWSETDLKNYLDENWPLDE